MYANPHSRTPVVNMLDAVILGAAEIALHFTVNVTTKANGVIMGGSGGHADTAAGAKFAIITTRLTAAGFPKIVERVGTLTTSGETVAVMVTEAGVCGQPALRRPAGPPAGVRPAARDDRGAHGARKEGASRQCALKAVSPLFPSTATER